MYIGAEAGRLFRSDELAVGYVRSLRWLAFSPDGSLLATRHHEDRTIVWDVATQGCWIVGSSSRNGDATDPSIIVSSSFGYNYNAKVIRWPINERKSAEPEGAPDIPGVPYVPFVEESLGSFHPGGTHIGMSDGSTSFVHNDLDVTVLKAMASRRSSETFELP